MSKTELIINSLYDEVPRGISLSLPFISSEDNKRTVSVFTYVIEHDDGGACISQLLDLYVFDSETLDGEIFDISDIDDGLPVYPKESGEEPDTDVMALQASYYALIDGYIECGEADSEEYIRLFSALEYPQLSEIYKSLGAILI